MYDNYLYRKKNKQLAKMDKVHWKKQSAILSTQYSYNVVNSKLQYTLHYIFRRKFHSYNFFSLRV